MAGDSNIARQLAEKLGLAVEAIGLPRMAGRVLGWMLLADTDEIALEELAQDLDVSKASISHATRLLEQIGVIERAARPGSRRAYYRLAADPWGALLAMEERISRGFVGFAREARQALPPNPDRTSRLDKMEEAFELYLQLLATFMEAWGTTRGNS